MPEPEADVELPVEDAVEQEQLAAPSAGADAAASGDQAAGDEAAADRVLLEANEADYAEQQSVVAYDDEDYR